MSTKREIQCNGCGAEGTVRLQPAELPDIVGGATFIQPPKRWYVGAVIGAEAEHVNVSAGERVPLITIFVCDRCVELERFYMSPSRVVGVG